MDGSQDLGYRYTMPQLELKPEGRNSMILSNLATVSQRVGRTCELLVAFFNHEVPKVSGTTGCRIKKNGAVSAPSCADHKTLQQAILDFIRQHVMCSVCCNPETRVAALRDCTTFLECSACGQTAPSAHKASPSFFRWMQDHPHHLVAVGGLDANAMQRHSHRSDAFCPLGTLSLDESEWSFPEPSDAISSGEWVS